MTPADFVQSHPWWTLAIVYLFGNTTGVAIQLGAYLGKRYLEGHPAAEKQTRDSAQLDLLEKAVRAAGTMAPHLQPQLAGRFEQFVIQTFQVEESAPNKSGDSYLGSRMSCLEQFAWVSGTYYWKAKLCHSAMPAACKAIGASDDYIHRSNAANLNDLDHASFHFHAAVAYLEAEGFRDKANPEIWKSMTGVELTPQGKHAIEQLKKHLSTRKAHPDN